jgi:hypothetical protein
MVTDGNFFSLPMLTANGGGQTILTLTGAYLTITSGTDRHTLAGFAIIEYTKT